MKGLIAGLVDSRAILLQHSEYEQDDGEAPDGAEYDASRH